MLTTTHKKEKAAKKDNKKKKESKGGGASKEAKEVLSMDEPSGIYCLPCYRCKKYGHFLKNCPCPASGAESTDSTVLSTTYRTTTAATTPVSFLCEDCGGNALGCVCKEAFSFARPSKSTTTLTFGASTTTLACQVGLRKNDILLDNQAGLSCFKDFDLLENVREADVSCEFNGIGGKILCTQIGEYQPFGSVYFHPKCIANILSWSQIKKDNCENISFHYDNEDGSFTVNLGRESFLFNEVSSGLHALVLTSVADNKKNFTQREIHGADKAKEFMMRLGVPSPETVIDLIQNGSLSHLDVTAQDVRNAVSIYGPDVASLKGKSTEPVNVTTLVDRVPKQHGVMLEMSSDLMFISLEAYLVSVFKPIGLIMVNYLGKKGAKATTSIAAAILCQVNKCKSEGFGVSVINFDGEPGAYAAAKILESRQVCPPFNPTPGSHVGEIEIVIRLVKNWFTKRGYRNVPAMESFRGIRVNMAKEARVAFGQYCHVVTPNSITKNNALIPRTQGAIALHPTGNSAGSVYFFILATGHIAVRTKWTELPFPDEVLRYVENIVDNDLVVVFDDSYDVDDDVRVEEASPEVRGELPVAVEDVVENDPEVVEQEVVDVFDEQVHVVDEQVHVVDEQVQIIDEVAVEVEVDVGEHLVEQDGIVEDHIAEPIEAPPPPRYNLRSNTRVDYVKLNDPHQAELDPPLFYGFNVSVKKGIKRFKDKAVFAITDEVEQMLKKRVWDPVGVGDPRVKGKQIRSFMFLKEKFLADGSFDKVKARLVASGNMMDKSLFGDTSSPTVSLSSILMVAAIAARESREVVTADISGAYLNADMNSQHESVFMVLEREVTSVLLDLSPDYSKFVRRDGTVIVELKKALYGCVQSARLWYEKLRLVLEGFQFCVNPVDTCVFNKLVGDQQITVVVYVDDLLISSVNKELIRKLEMDLISAFGQVKFNRGKKHNYLSMGFDFSVSGEVIITMKNYVDELLKFSGVEGKSKTPALENLFTIDNSSILLQKEERDFFHSVVAKLMYLAKRTRPDILLPVNFLATRVSVASESDYSKLQRILQYLNATQELGIILRIGDVFEVIGSIDASYGVHNDGKSHSGVVVSIGSGPIFVKSTKQKIVTKSSYEAELVALSDNATQILWSREFLIGQGFLFPKTKILQDNKAVISSIKKGGSSSERSRHISIRRFWLSERIEKGELTIDYCSTDEMISDLLTKPLQGEKFVFLRNKLLNWYA